MSFYTRVKTFIAGTSAKGADVKAELDAVAAAFDTVESSMVRSIKMPVGETTDQVVTGGPEARANKVLGCDSEGNVTWTTGVPASDALTVGGYAPSATAAANKVAVYNGSAKLPASITGDAATVGGYGVTTGTTALKVAVRDSNGALPGNITGNAATASASPYSGLTGVVPTWNQNTTGNAATSTLAETAITANNLSTMFTGRVTGAGASVKLPTGWTSSKNSTGIYVVTHNLGTTNYTVVCGADNNLTVSGGAGGANSFTVYCRAGDTGAATDSQFGFILVKDL